MSEGNLLTSGRMQKSWKLAVVGSFSKAFLIFAGNDGPNNRLSLASNCKEKDSF